MGVFGIKDYFDSQKIKKIIRWPQRTTQTFEYLM